MRRLIQPGWILFQIAVVAAFMWVVATTDSKEPPPYGFALLAGIFTAYALTIALLILNEGRKDVLRLIRKRRAATAIGHEAEAGQRLGSPQTPDRLGQPGSTDRRGY